MHRNGVFGMEFLGNRHINLDDGVYVMIIVLAVNKTDPFSLAPDETQNVKLGNEHY